LFPPAGQPVTCSHGGRPAQSQADNPGGETSAGGLAQTDPLDPLRAREWPTAARKQVSAPTSSRRRRPPAAGQPASQRQRRGPMKM